MPRQIYRCRVHGDFEVSVPFTADVPPLDACPVRCERAAPEGSRMARCYLPSPWQPPTGVSFKIK